MGNWRCCLSTTHCATVTAQVLTHMIIMSLTIMKIVIGLPSDILMILLNSVQLPDGEIPDGEHSVHIDLKVLGIKPVGLASLDLRFLFITMLIIILSSLSTF